MTTFTAKVSKTGLVKIPAGVMKGAKIKAGEKVTLIVPAERQTGKTRYANPAAFAKVLDEVIHDYSATLRKLA